MEQGSTLFYYIFPIIISIIALTGYKKPKTGFFIMLILLFFSMYRGDNVGTDTLNYMKDSRIQYRGGSLDYEVSFNYFINNFGSEIELIDVLINRIIYNWGLTPRIIIWSYSLITILFFYASLKRFRVNTSIGLMFFVLSTLYYQSFNIARQVAAVCVFLYGLSFILSNENKAKHKFIIWAVAAGFIHASAFFFLPLYFIDLVRLPRKLCVLIMIAICSICVLFSFDITSLFSHINIDYISGYLGVHENGGRSIMGRIYDIPIYTFNIFCFIKRSKDRIADTPDIFYTMAVCASALFIQVDGILARIILYISIYTIIYINSVLYSYAGLRDSKLRFLFVIYIFLKLYGVGDFGLGSSNSPYYLMF